MTILHNESCHGIGDVEIWAGNTFNTPDAIITFYDDEEIGTTAFKKDGNKAIFSVGRKYLPHNIEPSTDVVAAELADVSTEEFRAVANRVIEQYVNAPAAGGEARIAAETDYERIVEAAFRRVNMGLFTSDEAGLVWRAFETRNMSYTGIPYSGTESVLDLPDAVSTPSSSRTSLPA